MDMKNETLTELVEKWKRLAEAPDVRDGSPEAEIGNAKDDGRRDGYLRAAGDLRALINLLE
jgi:hypothetical protein